MYHDESADPPVLICQVGKTQLRYDLHAERSKIWT